MFDRAMDNLRTSAMGLGLTALVVGTAFALAFW
jgi:hypothetical protein